MKLTKLEHSGIVLEKDGQKLVFDPVEFADTLPELDNVVAVVITHKHGDHLQPEKISAILDRNPEARLLVSSDAASELLRAEIVKKGDALVVGEFQLEIFGDDHAAIIPGEIPCANIGVVVDGLVVNPGDSFDIPSTIEIPQVLLVASVAPWCRVDESMNYIESMKPKMAVPVHNALLSEMGNGVYNSWLRRACETVGAKFAPLGVGDSIEF